MKETDNIDLITSLDPVESGKIRVQLNDDPRRVLILSRENIVPVGEDKIILIKQTPRGKLPTLATLSKSVFWPED